MLLCLSDYLFPMSNRIESTQAGVEVEETWGRMIPASYDFNDRTDKSKLVEMGITRGGSIGDRRRAFEVGLKLCKPSSDWRGRVVQREAYYEAELWRTGDRPAVLAAVLLLLVAACLLFPGS